MADVPEHFRTTFSGWIASSAGFRVKPAGRTYMLYRDALGTIRIPGEALVSKPLGFMVSTEETPDTPDRPRIEVLANVTRAFQAVGWNLTVL